MTTRHDDDLEPILRPWMQRNAPDAPNEFVLRVLKEIEMSERAPTRGWISRFSTWSASSWEAVAAAVAIILAGSVLLTNLIGTPTPATRSSASPGPSAIASDPAAFADRLIRAWNEADGHTVATFYGPSANPLVRFMVNRSEFTTELITVADVEAYATTWQNDGSVLTRTGEVLARTPFVAFPATWTTPDGSFDGVVVIRISPAGLITEQYLIGATSSPGVTQSEAESLVTGWLEAQNAGDGSAAAELLAPSANGWVIRDGAVINNVPGRSAFVDAINSGTAGQASPSAVEVQGPFIVDTYSRTCSCDPGGVLQGIEVIEVNADWVIAHVWHMDTDTHAPASPVPTGSGG